jgi:hypothetical protein
MLSNKKVNLLLVVANTSSLCNLYVRKLFLDMGLRSQKLGRWCELQGLTLIEMYGYLIATELK